MIRSLAALALLAAIGCGGGGSGGSGGDSVSSALSIEPVDLPPGATSALLAWAPSEGAVESYIVYFARNGASFGYEGTVATPEIVVTGTAGDEVRVIVVATGPEGDVSDPSPESAPIRFRAAVAALAAADAPAAPAPLPIGAPDSPDRTPESATASDSAGTGPDAESQSSNIETRSQTDPEAAPDPDGTAAELSTSLRERLLRADLRLPEQGLTAAVSLWLQSHVDAQVAAGVSLAGVGDADPDGVRELVWRDPAGQLFVSDGGALVASRDPAATLEPAIRLAPTERFVGLALFDGDDVGDWLIEDIATGVVWVVNGATASEADVRPAGAEAARLVGHGDLDGDARPELVWRDSDGSLLVAAPASTGADRPRIAAVFRPPADIELLTLADLDGDGRDDLLARRADGTLAMARSRTAGGSPELEWIAAGDSTTASLELVATLDLDADGAAEIVWLNGSVLEVGSATTGPLLVESGP